MERRAGRARLTHGNKGGAFAIIGPKFKGTLPAGLEEIRADTSLCALGGRTYTAGKDDYPAVHKIQDEYKLIPLSHGKVQEPATLRRPMCLTATGFRLRRGKSTT
jgi:hypothetical protein